MKPKKPKEIEGWIVIWEDYWCAYPTKSEADFWAKTLYKDKGKCKVKPVKIIL